MAVSIATLGAALLLPWPYTLLPCAVAVADAGAFNRRQFRSLFSKSLWAGLVIVLILPVWVLGPGRGHVAVEHVGGLPVGLAMGLTMALRVLTTMAALLAIGGCISPLALTSAAGRVLGRRLAMACAIGVNLLPAMIEILRRTTLALRLRGGFRRHRLTNCKRLLTAVGVQTVRLTEDVADALLLAQAAQSHGEKC